MNSLGSKENRIFKFEERLTFIDNNQEIQGIIFALTDMIIAVDKVTNYLAF